MRNSGDSRLAYTRNMPDADFSRWVAPSAIANLIPKLSDQHGSIDRADEVTLSRKGAKGTKSRTGVRGPRSTGTKASRRVGKTRKSPPGSDKKLKARVRDLELRICNVR